jgi:RNA polymerase sigma-B factor
MRTNRKLPPEEIERLLMLYIQTRRADYRDRIVEAHLYIAEIIARKFAGRGVDYDDLFQVAALALTKAIERFDPERGVKFASFVTPGMVGEVKNYFRDKARIIRPPRRAGELARIVEAAREALTQELHRSPTVEEIADHANLSEEEVIEGLEASASQPVSLDMQTSDEDEDLSLSSVLGGEDKGFSEFETADMLKRGMARLNEQQREIIYLRFFENLSQREVAQRIGVSQMSVSRAERSALERLRDALMDSD